MMIAPRVSDISDCRSLVQHHCRVWAPNKTYRELEEQQTERGKRMESRRQGQDRARPRPIAQAPKSPQPLSPVGLAPN